MNFNEWAQKRYNIDYETCSYRMLSRIAHDRETWEACKKEILKTINNQNGQWQDDMMLKYLIDKDELIKEIEKI